MFPESSEERRRLRPVKSRMLKRVVRIMRGACLSRNFSEAEYFDMTNVPSLCQGNNEISLMGVCLTYTV